MKGHGTWDNDRPPVAGVVGRESGEIGLQVCRHSDRQTLQPFVEDHTPDDAAVYTDEWQAYNHLAETGRTHASVCHTPGQREWARDDDGDGVLEAYAKASGVQIVKSGYELKTKWNSHGEILSKFVLEHPGRVYYLFLDTDTCFIQNDTIDTMLWELERAPTAFGIAPRLSSNGETEIEEEYWDKVYNYRLHPCCALVRNTAVFRRVVEEIGLSCVQYLWAAGEEYLDTFKLMSMVMKTHGCPHILSCKMILHFFSVSYDWEPQHAMEFKAGLRDRLLGELRNSESSQSKL